MLACPAELSWPPSGASSCFGALRAPTPSWSPSPRRRQRWCCPWRWCKGCCLRRGSWSAVGHSTSPSPVHGLKGNQASGLQPSGDWGRNRVSGWGPACSSEGHAGPRGSGWLISNSLLVAGPPAHFISLRLSQPDTSAQWIWPATLQCHPTLQRRRVLSPSCRGSPAERGPRAPCGTQQCSNSPAGPAMPGFTRV